MFFIFFFGYENDKSAEGDQTVSNFTGNYRVLKLHCHGALILSQVSTTLTFLTNSILKMFKT